LRTLPPKYELHGVPTAQDLKNLLGSNRVEWIREFVENKEDFYVKIKVESRE
jgi:hypothetical protein